MSDDERRWQDLLQWCESKIERLKSQKDLSRNTPIGSGQLMAFLSVVDEIKRLTDKKPEPDVSVPNTST